MDLLTTQAANMMQNDELQSSVSHAYPQGEWLSNQGSADEEYQDRTLHVGFLDWIANDWKDYHMHQGKTKEQLHADISLYLYRNHSKLTTLWTIYKMQ